MSSTWHTLIKWTCAYLSIVISPHAGFAAQFVFGVSPSLPEPCAKSAYQQILLFVAEKVKLGDIVAIVDASSTEPSKVAEFRIGTSNVYKRAQARIKANEEAANTLLSFLKSDTARVNAMTPRRATVLVPQLTKYVADVLFATGPKPEIIIVGDVLYDDSVEPQFSMRGGKVPTDAHLNASRRESVFGTRGEEQRLQGARVHIASCGSEWLSDLHKSYVERFWALYVEGLGGQFMTMTTDIAATLERAMSPSASPIRVEPPRSLGESRLLMLPVRRPVEQVVVDEAFKKVPEPPAAKIETGKPAIVTIIWDCVSECDLDLYVKKTQAKEWLYFGKTETADGRFYKYAGAVGNPLNRYEYVELNAAVNLADLVIAVNFYQGRRKGGPRGVVRLVVDGKAHEVAFHIIGEVGNQGQGYPNRMQEDVNWVYMRVSEILGGRREFDMAKPIRGPGRK